MTETAVPVTPFIHLIVQYYNHRLPERQAEFDYCLRRNLDNPFVSQVHNLVDPETTVPAEFRQHPKYNEQNEPGQRLTFAAALDYANRDLVGQIVAIANLDIFLDESAPWDRAEALIHPGVVLALSRTEFDPAGAPYMDPQFAKLAFATSQDAWVFAAPFTVPDCDFPIGTLGCDNAFADRILRAGRIPLNLPNRFRIFHYDRCRGKTSENQAEIHAVERGDRPFDHPEEKGYYLVPDYEQVQNIDAFMNKLGVPTIHRYRMVCDALTRLYEIRNT